MGGTPTFMIHCTVESASRFRRQSTTQWIMKNTDDSQDPD
jgi:hypothetical protein